MRKRIIYTCPHCYREFTADTEYDSDEGVEYVECPHCHAKPTVAVRPVLEFGNKAKITGNTTSHRFEIGEEVVITEIHIDCGVEIYYKATNGTSEWFVSELDVETVKEPSTAIEKFGHEIVEALRQRMGLDYKDSSRDDEFLTLSPAEAIDGWLSWEGICGYTNAILGAVEDAYKIKLSR